MSGALAVADAGLLPCASFPVAAATAEVLWGTGARTVAFVVTGDDGRAAADLACTECQRACGAVGAGCAPRT